MRRWDRCFDWDHLQNWVPGTLGSAAVILLVVVAANSPTQTNSKPAELPSSQSAAMAIQRSNRYYPGSFATGRAIFCHKQRSESPCATDAHSGRYHRRSRQAGADARSRHRQS